MQGLASHTIPRKGFKRMLREVLLDIWHNVCQFHTSINLCINFISLPSLLLLLLFISNTKTEKDAKMVRLPSLVTASLPNYSGTSACLCSCNWPQPGSISHQVLLSPGHLLVWTPAGSSAQCHCRCSRLGPPGGVRTPDTRWCGTGCRDCDTRSISRA